MRPRATLLLVLAALVLGVGGTTLFFTLRDDSGSTGSPAASDAATTGANPAETELLDLLNKAGGGTYHARYSLTSPAATQQKVTYSFELWRKDSLFRADTSVSGAQTVVTRALQGEGGSVVCQNAGNTTWVCKKTSVAPVNPTTTQLTAIKELLSGGSVSVRDATIAGTTVRCFTVSVLGAGTSTTLAAAVDQYEVCLTSDGVAARSSHAGEVLELVTLDDDVPDVVFAPPAPITG